MSSNFMFVRRIFLAVFIIIITVQLPAQVQTARYVTTNAKSNAYYEYLPQGYDPGGTTKYPLIVFIHGMGELGAGTPSSLPAVLRNGTPRQINQGIFPTSFTVNGVVSKPIVISPQFTEWPWASDINILLDYLVANYKVDTRRIYLTGLSMGGGVVWDYVNTSAAYANRIAAIVPICGASWPNQNGANIIAAANLPIWATHNDGDPTVTVNNTINFVNYVNAAPVPPNPLAKKTIFSSSSHDAWTKTYDLNFRENNLNIYEWMFSYSKGANTNIPPVVNAGANQSLAYLTTTTTLFGTVSDPDGTISSFTWTKVSGPASGSVTSPNSLTTTVTGLVSGTYVFRLTATDNGNASGFANVTVIVNGNNQGPWVNAGSNQTITLPVNTVTLSGTATDPDGTVISTLWNKQTGPSGGTITNPSSLTTTVTGLVAGIYVFQLVATDNSGTTTAVNVTITVKAAPANQLPVVNAGSAQTITLPANSVSLTGTATDADGTISSYAWSFVSGNTGYTISSPSTAATIITGLTAGTYVFKLTATDNDGGSASSNITINVSSAPVNVLPVVNAGSDQTITLPVNTATLSGTASDTDGSIIGTAWTKISGPTGGLITSLTTNVTTITSLQAGTYVYRFTAKDNALATVSDTVMINVINAPIINAAPVANAGSDQTINLPVNTVTLTGSGTDADGTIVSYLWTKVSGPSGGTITSSNISTTTITSLQAGLYVYSLTVTDNNGTTGTDNVNINVIAATVTPPTGNTIRVNIFGGRNPSVNPLWNNNWNVADASSYFVNESNLVTTVQARFNAIMDIQDNGASYGTGSAICPADVLRYNATSSYNRSLIITGLNPAKTYSIQFFGSSNILGNKTVFQIGRTKVTLNTDNNISTSANFAGVVPTSAGSLKVSILRTGTYINVAGFIIKEETTGSARMINSSMEEEEEIVATENNDLILNVFPNPVQSVVQVKTTTELNSRIQYSLVDANGKMRYTSQKKSMQTSDIQEINMSALTPGVYILSVIIEGKQYIRKLIKN